MKKGLSLRTRVLLVFLTVMLVVVVIFFVMNNVFWREYYIHKSEKDMTAACTELSAVVSDPKAGEEELYAAIVNAQAKNIDFALQGSTDWEFMIVTRRTVSEHERNFLLQRLQTNLLMEDTDEVRVLKKTEDYTLQRAELKDIGRFLECYGYMEDEWGTEKKFIMSMPLDNIFRASSASNVYYIYISAAVILIGSIVIVFICRNLTKPILTLSDISKRMSHLDFSARYTDDSGDEIGELGNNMNEMSSQLERTILQLQMANEELQKDIREKEQVDEMRKDFISNVSHELKTPIALIQGYAEGLKEIGKDDPDSMDYYIDVITDEAAKMNRMVKKLTTLNQLEFGADDLQEGPFDIMEMIRGLVENSRKMQEDHRAKVTVDGPDTMIVWGDEFKIEEVVQNYYSNAFNHLAEPNEIRFTAVDLGPVIRINVKNTGEPIPEDELEKIWIKFHKVDKARTRAYGGSGIGLSIVKAIMDAHGEECGVYNEADGVVFWFELTKFEEYREQSEQ